MEHLLVATFKSIKDELLAKTIETGAIIVLTYIPGVSENTLCLPYDKYVKSEGYKENDASAKGFIINDWSGKSSNPQYTGDLEVLYEDVNFRFKSKFTATNSTITAENNTLLLGSTYHASVIANEGYTLSSVTVRMGGQDKTNECYSNGEVEIGSILGDIEIIANAEINKLALIIQGDPVDGLNTPVHGTSYEFDYNNKPDDISVTISPGYIYSNPKVRSDEYELGTDYTFENNKIHFLKNLTKNGIIIILTEKEETVLYTLTVKYQDKDGNSIAEDVSVDYTDTSLSKSEFDNTYYRPSIIKDSIEYTYFSGAPTDDIDLTSNPVIILVYERGETPVETYTVTYEGIDGITFDPETLSGIEFGGNSSSTFTATSGCTIGTPKIISGTSGTPTISDNILTVPNVQSDVVVLLGQNCEEPCIELDPEYGIQTNLMYYGETETNIIYHTLVNGEPVEVSEKYIIEDIEAIHTESDGTAIWSTLEQLYGENFLGYYEGVLNGCDGDVTFHIYVINCSEVCVEVLTEGCIAWNISTLTYGTDYKIFNLSGDSREYVQESEIASTVITKLTKNMNQYNADTPSDHIYWIKLEVTLNNGGKGYALIPVCEYYNLTTNSVGTIEGVYTSSGELVPYFKKGDNVTITHQNQPNTSYSYTSDVFFTVPPEKGSEVWRVIHGMSSDTLYLSVGPQYLNAFKNLSFDQNKYLLFTSWNDDIQPFETDSFFTEERLNKLNLTYVTMVSTNFDPEEYKFYFVEKGGLEPILLKYSDSSWGVYPKFVLNYSSTESTSSSDVIYHKEDGTTIYFKAPFSYNMLNNKYKCSENETCYGAKVNGENIVFPKVSFEDLLKTSDLGIMTVTSSPIYSNQGLTQFISAYYHKKNLASYVLDISNGSTSSGSAYHYDTYIIPLGLSAYDLKANGGESSETMSSLIDKISIDDSTELNISLDKLSNSTIKDLGVNIHTYTNNAGTLYHEITNLNGDMYLYELDGVSLGCIAYAKTKAGGYKTYALAHSGETYYKSWTEDVDGSTYECSASVNCLINYSEETAADCHCLEICTTNYIFNFIDCNENVLESRPVTISSDSSQTITFDKTVDGIHWYNSIVRSGDCNTPEKTEDIILYKVEECSPINRLVNYYTYDDSGNNKTIVYSESYDPPQGETCTKLVDCDGNDSIKDSVTKTVSIPDAISENYYIRKYDNTVTVEFYCTNENPQEVLVHEYCDENEKQYLYEGSQINLTDMTVDYTPPDGCDNITLPINIYVETTDRYCEKTKTGANVTYVRTDTVEANKQYQIVYESTDTTLGSSFTLTVNIIGCL